MIHKVTVNGFSGTPVQVLLRNLGIDGIVLVGGSTYGCVESTGRGAADLGFKVAMVEDAVSLGAVFDGAKGGFPPPFLHDATMVNFCSFIGRVTTTDELIAEWGYYPQGELTAAAGGPRARV